jgi:hypothetical protein
MLTHTQAKQIVDGLPGVNDVESLFLRAVALHETSYGAGWKLGEGAGSWNMGAITTLHPNALSFKHVDSKYSDATGKIEQYTTWFAGWPTATEGFAGLRDTVLKPNVREALTTRDVLGAVSAMYDNHYFLGLHTHSKIAGDRDNIKEYYAAVARCIESIGKETGERHPTVLPPEDVA